MIDYMTMIKTALDDAVGKAVDITPETHLTEEEVIDSLDSAVFLLNMEKASGVKLGEDAVKQHDLFKISNLLTFLKENPQT